MVPGLGAVSGMVKTMGSGMGVLRGRVERGYVGSAGEEDVVVCFWVFSGTGRQNAYSIASY